MRFWSGESRGGASRDNEIWIDMLDLDVTFLLVHLYDNHSFLDEYAHVDISRVEKKELKINVSM